MQPMSRWRTLRRRRLLWLALPLLLVLLLAGSLAYQVLTARAHVRRLRWLIRRPTTELLTSARLNEVQAQLRGLEGNLGALRPLANLGPILGWLPGAGPSLRALPRVLAMDTQLCRAGEYAIQAVRPLAEAPKDGPGAPLSERLASLLTQDRTTLTAFTSAASSAKDERMRLRSASLTPFLARHLAKVDTLLLALGSASSLLRVAPGMLGQDGARTYLLLAGNSDELRPGGGAIAGVGTLTIKNGQVKLFRFTDSLTSEDWDIAHPAPPAALTRYLGASAWALRDAAWSPDFPTAAQAAADLYGLNQRTHIDGVLALDLPGLAGILGAVGPVQVPGYDTTVDGSNVLATLREHWAPTGTGTPGLAIKVAKPFKALAVHAYYQRQAGAAWFDDLQLLDSSGRNLLRNASFEDGLQEWQGVNLGTEDGSHAQHTHSGKGAARLQGDEAADKEIVQRIECGGQAGETFYLDGWGWLEAPGQGTYGLGVEVEYADGSTGWFALPLPRREGAWYDGAGEAQLDGWYGQRDAFVAALAHGLFDRLQAGPQAWDGAQLLAALRGSLDAHHLQLYFADPVAQGWLVDLGWDGSVPRPAGDVLLVADANLGRNKVNAVVSQQMAYRVTLDDQGGARCELAIVYRNGSPANAAPCPADAIFATSYSEASQGCYQDYVRVFAPAGSRLLGVSGADEIDNPAVEDEMAVFGAYFSLAPGLARTLHFTYQLPAGTIRPAGPYTLLARKQAGTGDIPLTVEVVPPPGKPGLLPSGAASGPARYLTVLDQDRRVSLAWK
jgi:hypothetical protein